MAVCATLTVCSSARAQTNEVLCNQDLANVSYKLQRAYAAALGRCIRFMNYPDCSDPASDFGVLRSQDKLAAALAPGSHCDTAVSTDGVPVSNFGPTTCPAAWNDCDLVVPSIDTLSDLEQCLRCVHYGMAMRYRSLLDLPDASVISSNDRKCVRATEKATSKAYLKSVKEVLKCGRGGVKPFACAADDSPGTKLAKALEGIAKKAGRCRDETGTRGALGVAIYEMTRHAVESPVDYADALKELSRCMACQEANLIFGQAQDCAAFSGLWRCGQERPSRAGYVFVANEGGDSVTIFDEGDANADYLNGTLANSSFAVGAGPVALAANAAMNRLYVVNRDDGTVTCLDGRTGDYASGDLLGSTITVGGTPVAVALNSPRDILYVVNQGDDSVTLLDGADGSYLYGSFAASTVPVGLQPSAVELSPDGTVAYVTNFGDDTITYLDGATGAYLYGTLAASTFATGAGPSDVSVAQADWPYSPKLAITNTLENTVTILDAVNGTPWYGSLQDSTFPAGSGPGAVQFMGEDIYVAEETGNRIMDISGFEPTYTEHTGVIAAPSDLATPGCSSTDCRLYVAASASDEIRRYDLDSSPDAIVGKYPAAVAVNETAGIVYVVNVRDDTVSYLDATTGAYLNGTFADSTFAVGDHPRAVAVNETAGIVYVTNFNDDTVTYLDATTGAYLNGTFADSTFAVGNGPTDIAVSETAGIVYVTDAYDDTVTYLDATTGAYLNGTFADSTFAVGDDPS
ncbi:MAG: hypothetical protein D6815_07865, partial [Candidatus Dadabacteria bacterium]